MVIISQALSARHTPRQNNSHVDGIAHARPRRQHPFTGGTIPLLALALLGGNGNGYYNRGLTFALILGYASLSSAVWWHGNNSLVSRALLSRDVAITPSYITGPFNLSVILHRGQSIEPLLSVRHLEANVALIIDTRNGQLLLYGLSPISIVHWSMLTTDVTPILSYCSLQVFYNALFAATHSRLDVLLLAIVDGINTLYRPAGIAFTVQRPLMLLPQTPAALAYDTLSSFAHYTKTWQPPVCSHLLFDGQVYPDGLVGLAFLNQSCTPTYNTALVAWPDNPAVLVLVGAHELAHGLGVEHDGTDNTCASNGDIMAPILDTGSPGFSQCSLQALQTWSNRASACVTSNASVYDLTPGPSSPPNLTWIAAPVVVTLLVLGLLGWWGYRQSSSNRAESKPLLL